MHELWLGSHVAGVFHGVGRVDYIHLQQRKRKERWRHPEPVQEATVESRSWHDQCHSEWLLHCSWGQMELREKDRPKKKKSRVST